MPKSLQTYRSKRDFAATREASGKVIDFMALLQKSIEVNERTPAARPAGRHRKSPKGPRGRRR